MITILHLSASPRGERSLTRRLGAELLTRLLSRHPEARIIARDLVADPLPHVSGTTIAAMFTRPDQRPGPLNDAIVLSDALVTELTGADLIVLECPMFNWSVPSALKAWIDHIVRIGVTFRPPDGSGEYQGLLRDRPAYIVVASGGIYTIGPRGAEDYLTPYLRQVLGFIGLRDLRFVHAEDVMASADTALASGQRALAEMRVGA